MKLTSARALLLGCAILLSVLPASAQAQRTVTPAPAPDRRADEGIGPFKRLILRGANVIDGTGSPPYGPVDIVIENDRIIEMRSVGTPNMPIDPARRPQNADREVDVSGMYVMPGFVDGHAHIGGAAQGTTAEYVYKLWLGHGVTTARDPGAGNGIDWTLRERARSESNSIVAPHLYVYARPGQGWERGTVTTPLLAREWVRWAAAKGVDGLKLSSYEPEIMAALIDEARKNGMGTTAHLAQTGVARMNVLDAARVGLHSIEHWYGLPEALFDSRTVQSYRADYNYNDEYHRFAEAGKLWKQAAAPGSTKWNAVMDELLKLNFVLEPTFTIYEANRDVARASNAEWHERFTLPSLWRFYQPSRENHGSYWFDWTTQNEIDWKENYRLWMQFVNEYKNRGGKVCTGSDSGYIYKLYGFDFIREFELLQEAGFHPLEVVRAATICNAEQFVKPKGRTPDFGLVKTGMRADLVVVEQNPLHNFKVLYGTGVLKLNERTQQPERVGGVKYTIKDGIVYDARQLLNDVARMVEEARRKAPASEVTSSQ